MENNQAASAINNLKMSDSPAKKLDFAAGKENLPFETSVSPADDLETKQTTMDNSVKEKPVVTVAAGIKPEEADEPLLQENPNRFVLFPIKYHEVSTRCHASPRVKCNTNTTKDLADVQEGRGLILDSRGD